MNKSKGFTQHHFLGGYGKFNIFMKRKSDAGFTIIELLVVVAIIAVLAAIVLVNVTGYINQGKNAAVKGNMATILTNAAVYYDSSSLGNGSYANFSTNVLYTAPAAAAGTANGGTALTYGSKTDTNTQWCSCSVLKTVSGSTDTVFCVDSAGTKIGYATACSNHCTAGTAATDGVCK